MGQSWGGKIDLNFSFYTFLTLIIILMFMYFFYKSTSISRGKKILKMKYKKEQ